MMVRINGCLIVSLGRCVYYFSHAKYFTQRTLMMERWGTCEKITSIWCKSIAAFCSSINYFSVFPHCLSTVSFFLSKNSCWDDFFLMYLMMNFHTSSCILYVFIKVFVFYVTLPKINWRQFPIIHPKKLSQKWEVRVSLLASSGSFGAFPKPSAGKYAYKLGNVTRDLRMQTRSN